MTTRHRLIRVPASSANLGPGYDVLAAAVSLFMELEVEEVGEVHRLPFSPTAPTSPSSETAAPVSRFALLTGDE